jgi:hypothetical protein
MSPTPKVPQNGNGNVNRMDNHRIFRPEAVQAYSTRRAGAPWAARTRFESWIILGLTAIAGAAAATIFLGGH